jgi:hypothetical protein
MSQLDEIRVNNFYSTHSISEYPNGESGDSKPVINKRRIRTTELLNKLKSNVSIKREGYKVDHLFPPNCRYYEQHTNGHLVVIEEPPAFRTIAVDKDMSNEIESLRSSGKLEEYGYENWAEENKKRPYMFNLALPYVVFFMAFNKGYDLLGGSLFFRTKPISGFSDPLCRSPFLNINESQTVCFGDRIHNGPKRSIYGDSNHVISTFWSTIFNSDYIYNYVEYQGVAGLCDYLTWEYYSHTDPMFVYTADWINYEGLNVGQAVDQTREWIVSRDDRRGNEFGYNTIAGLFEQQNEIGLAEVPGVDGVKEPLLYDVSQYMFIGDEVINVGDSFKSKNGQYLFIDSFLGFRKVVNPSFLNIEREDGRIFRMKMTRAVRDYISSKIKEERYESQVELPNGIVLKSGDILVMKNKYDHDVYRKIYYLRKTPEGDLEGRFGSEFYVIENLPDDITVLDLQNPEYMGISLKQDNEYFILRGSGYPAGPVLNVSFCKFQEVVPGTRGNLEIKFIESQGANKGQSYKINFTEQHERKVFDIESLRELPPVFRIGKRIFYPRHGSRRNGEYTQGNAYILPNLGVAVPYNTSLRSADYQKTRNQFIKDDTFKIESWDMDIEFKIGDKVVIANWENPIDMLTVKQIEGFVENTDNGTISFAVTDKNGNASNHLYIDSRQSVVKVGTVRKITNTWEDLSAGMKIKAEVAGISMFPKKDFNIIIGFLYDTGGPEPLVLCSNACTLWYSDVIQKFNITPISDPKWKELKHASINPSKMRFQSGDLLNGGHSYHSNCGYLAFKPRASRTIRAHQLQYFTDYDESYAFDRDFTVDASFNSFPNPRLTSKQEQDLGFINAFPNFHGMFTETGRYFSRYLFANDPRSILNVSNSN